MSLTNWENFEFNHQVAFAPLIYDTTQKQAFMATNRCHERMFFDLVTRVIKPSHFFEIGAHEAATARRVAGKLPEAHCVAFEADPDIHQHYTAQHKLSAPISNFRYIQSAVSDYDGEVRFQKQMEVDGKAASNLLANNSLKKKKLGSRYREVVTPCTRMDTFADQNGPIENAVLRIDVEGLCYEVLVGSTELLKRCSAIYAEVEDYEIWDGQKTVFDIYPILDDLGFVPVSRDVESSGQYNVLWLPKRNALERRFRSRLSLYYNELVLISRSVEKSLD